MNIKYKDFLYVTKCCDSKCVNAIITGIAVQYNFKIEPNILLLFILNEFYFVFI